MEDAKKQLADKLKTANNILVTVSRDPSVDQLAACIGLTLLLNKQGKHAAAVFSGEVPSTLEFLQPGETLEKNTDSLRDFIIALDKSKADKLRYKVEDNVVRIFITPYKTSITQDDFEFSQGDFNVDVVVALGVHQQEDLDEAITAHGRILHDAAVTSINTSPEGNLGTINWVDQQASSLSELVTDLAQLIDSKLLDEQISTALLTGIVAETERFSNEKTSSQTMSVSAALMAAGANQQLVASKLEESVESESFNRPEGESDSLQDESSDESSEKHDGTLEIEHEEGSETGNPDDSNEEETPEFELPAPDESEATEEPAPEADLADTSESSDALSTLSPGSKIVTEPPALGGTLTANSTKETLDPTTDPLSLPESEPPQLLDHKPEPLASPSPAWTPPPATPAPQPVTSPVSDPLATAPIDAATTDVNHTLTELEESVESPPAETPKEEGLDAARDEVSRALSDANAMAAATPEPIQALNAQPFDLTPPAPEQPVAEEPISPQPTPPEPPVPNQPPPGPTLDEILGQTSSTPDPLAPAAAEPASPTPTTSPDPTPTEPPTDVATAAPVQAPVDPNAPPPVPPPIPFQFGNPQSPSTPGQ